MTGARAKRPPTRNLVRWTEDMDIQMLLILQKICNQKAVKLPWDEVGAQLGGTITGGAIIQHLAKLRARRVEQGLPVPEPLKRGSGSNVTLSTGAVNSSGGARKGRQGKRQAASSFNTSNEDDEEDFDVDNASDPEGLFGDVRKKRVKRKIEDDIEEDDHGMMTKSKGAQSSKNSRAAKKIQTNFREDTKENLKEESSPEASSVTASERAGRRTSMNYARLHNGESENDTDDEINEPHVAAGSSFLRLERVASIGHKGESVNDHDEAEDAEIDEELVEYEGKVSRDASVPLNQEDDDKNNITVLHLGKSERSLDLLKALASSFTSATPLGYASSAVVENVGHLPANFDHRASMDLRMSGVSGAMTGDNLNHQYFSNANDMNFGFGHHSQYHTSPYANAFPGYSSAPYSSAMPELMHPTPVAGQGFPIFQRESYGNDMDNSLYSNLYGGGRNIHAMTAPQTPVSGGGFPGHNDYAARALFSNILPSHAPHSNVPIAKVLPSQILRSNDFSSLSNTRDNSMSTSATTNGKQNIQNYAQNNTQVKDMDFSNGEKLTNIYPSILPSQILRSNDFSSLSNTRNNSMSTNATTNGLPSIQNYALDNNQAQEMDFNNEEKPTNIYPFPTSEQQAPTLDFDTGLNNNFLGGESFGAVFDRFVSDTDGGDF